MARTIPEPSDYDYIAAERLLNSVNRIELTVNLFATVRWLDSLLQAPLLQADKRNPDVLAVIKAAGEQHGET